MTEQKENICYFCSMGCGLIIETDADEAAYLEHKMDDPVNGGTLCAKGNYCLEMINHPQRLFAAQKRGSEIPLDNIISEMGSAISKAGDSLAVVISGRASVEELSAAASFAKTLGTDYCAINMPTGDYELFKAVSEVKTDKEEAELDDITKADCVLAIGDPFSIGPCISKRFFASKYSKRGHSINVIAPEENLVSKFALSKIIGSVPQALLAVIKEVISTGKAQGPFATVFERILGNKKFETDEASARTIASRLTSAQSSVVVCASTNPLAGKLSAILAGLLDNTKMLVLNDYGNARKFFEVYEQKKTVTDIIETINRGEVKTLLCLGADLVRSYPSMDVEGALKKLNCLIVSASFPNKMTALADYIVPEAIWLEKEGTFTRGKQSPVVSPPGAAMNYGEIVSTLANECGKKLDSKPMVKRKITHHIKENDIEAIIDAALTDEFKPSVVSTAKKFSDGAITDLMNWYICSEERVQ